MLGGFIGSWVLRYMNQATIGFLLQVIRKKEKKGGLTLLNEKKTKAKAIERRKYEGRDEKEKNSSSIPGAPLGRRVPYPFQPCRQDKSFVDSVSPAISFSSYILLIFLPDGQTISYYSYKVIFM